MNVLLVGSRKYIDVLGYLGPQPQEASITGSRNFRRPGARSISATLPV